MSLIENSKFGEVVNAAHGYMLEKIRHGDLINNDLKHQYFQSQTKQNITKSNFSINREVNGQSTPNLKGHNIKQIQDRHALINFSQKFIVLPELKRQSRKFMLDLRAEKSFKANFFEA